MHLYVCLHILMRKLRYKKVQHRIPITLTTEYSDNKLSQQDKREMYTTGLMILIEDVLRRFWEREFALKMQYFIPGRRNASPKMPQTIWTQMQQSTD